MSWILGGLFVGGTESVLKKRLRNIAALSMLWVLGMAWML